MQIDICINHLNFHNCIYEDVYDGPRLWEDGTTSTEWLDRLKKHFPYLIWLNPEPMPEQQNFWSQTHWQLAQIFPMFDLSAEGLEKGMKRLMAKR